jgi:hypothetical protein
MSSVISSNGEDSSSRLNWAPILGKWDITELAQIFLGEGQPGFAFGQSFPMGLAVSNAVFQNGHCRVRIEFSNPFGPAEQAAGIVIGYRSPEQHYVFAELGAARTRYGSNEFVGFVGFCTTSCSGSAAMSSDTSPTTSALIPTDQLVALCVEQRRWLCRIATATLPMKKCAAQRLAVSVVGRKTHPASRHIAP